MIVPTAKELRELEHRRHTRERRQKAKTARPASQKASRGRVIDKPYLAWIRRQPCCVAHNGGCIGPVQACHLRYSDAAHGRINPGLSVKPSDHLVTPLCAHHHQIQHGGRESAFWAVMGVDPAALCKILRAEYEAQP